MTRKQVVIVCGMPRSATTLVQDLLNEHGQILLYNEFPLYTFRDVMPLISAYEQFVTSDEELWREISPAEAKVRKGEILFDLWRVGSKGAKHDTEPANFRVVGMKTPLAETEFRFWGRAFEAYDLKYIYCVRHPCRVLESLCSTWMRQHADPVTSIRNLYSNSYHHLCAIERIDAECVLTVQADRVGQTTEERLAFCRRILDFLGVELTPGVLEFVEKWPSINDSVRFGPKAKLPNNWVQTFCSDPHILEFAERFNYELPSTTDDPIDDCALAAH